MRMRYRRVENGLKKGKGRINDLSFLIFTVQKIVN